MTINVIMDNFKTLVSYNQIKICSLKLGFKKYGFKKESVDLSNFNFLAWSNLVVGKQFLLN